MDTCDGGSSFRARSEAKRSYVPSISSLYSILDKSYEREYLVNSRSNDSAIGIFIDGTLETVHWPYPRADFVSQVGTYTIGDAAEDADTSVSWSFGSCCLLGKALGTLPVLDTHFPTPMLNIPNFAST